MADATERFIAAAPDDLVVAVTRYPAGTRTAAATAVAIGCGVAQIVKSLVFMGDGEPVLVLTSGANHVDTTKAAAAIGLDDLGKADADQVRAATGYAIGGTPPMGHARPLPTVIDRDLLAHDTVWAAAGAPDSVFPLSPRDLVTHTSGVVADVSA